MADSRLVQVERLLIREAELLDKRRWDEWLALMAPDVEYWIPAWDSELEHTNDPDSELSLVYYSSRAGLEDRVYRIRTGQSSASNPLPRTCHMVGNVRADFHSDAACGVEANWQVLSYRLEETTTFFGFYEYLLERTGDDWRIKRKKIVVLNALIPAVLDIYLV